MNKEQQEEIKQVMNCLTQVQNMRSNKGTTIPNQFIIDGVNFVLFQSYRSPIALKYKGKTYLFKDWDYSKTTGKYRNMFLKETKKETEEKLLNGEYIAVDFEVL